MIRDQGQCGLVCFDTDSQMHTFLASISSTNLDPTSDVNIADKDGNTPLWWAARLGYVGLVRKLLNTPKIDVNTNNNDGRTALHAAALHGHLPVVRTLLQCPKTEVTKAYGSEFSLMDEARAKGYEEIAKSIRSRDEILRWSRMSTCPYWSIAGN